MFQSPLAKRILVTGGAGYIGSHTVKRLVAHGITPLVYDNLSRGHQDFAKWGNFVKGDIRDQALLAKTMQDFQPDVVLHFAAFAYVGESVSHPGLYYDNNVGGTLALLQAMQAAGVKRLVVSSTCATYGQPDSLPITETTPQRPLNPYGHSKLMMEQIARDFDQAHGIRSVALRYFNAAGGDPDGDIGERHDPEPHLIPRLFMAQDGEIDALDILGDDYPTPDGTCIRDYIHVNDLAEAHILAAHYLMSDGPTTAFNLGTGQGASVKEMIATAARVTGRAIPHRISARRPGDPAVLVADASKAHEILGWQPQHSSLTEILASAWHWHRTERQHRKNP
jgi:UDP-arabinose 4-epimerase